MNAARLLLLLLLIVVAVVVVLVVLRRGSAQRDAQRVEAAGLRSEADTLAATMAGQSAYAEQAAQRAELARLEAEDKARQAERLEAEAAEHKATVEAAQRDYDTTMRRADDIDPDVKESAFPPVADPAGDDDDDEDDGVGEPATAVSGSSDAAPAPAGATAPAAAGATAAAVAARDGNADDTTNREGTADDPPMTRAERREARESGSSEANLRSPEPGAGDETGSALPTAAAGAAAAGATAWGARDDADASPESQRIASAADFRDDVPAEQADPGEVYRDRDGGNDSGMSQETDSGTTEHTQRDDGPGAGEGAGLAAAGAGGAGAAGAYAATRAMHEDDRFNDGGEDGVEGGTDDDADSQVGRAEAGTSTGAHSSADSDVSHDVETPRGEWGGPHDDETAGEGRAAEDGTDTGDRDASAGDAGGMSIIAEPEAYAATEPVMAQDQAPPVSPDDTEDDNRVGDSNHGTDPAAHDTDEATRVGDSATSTGSSVHDDGHDHHDHDHHDHEGHDHGVSGTELEDADHAPAEAGAAVTETGDADRGSVHESAEERFDTTPGRDWAADEGELLEESSQRADRLEGERDELAARDESTGQASAARRISGFDELRDGGFGVGSAAPLDDGAQPLDHPVQADRDSMTYRLPGDAGYDSTDPHVWFYDEGAAQRSGFRRSDA